MDIETDELFGPEPEAVETPTPEPVSAPEPVETPTPEPEAEPEPQQRDEQGRFVPIDALHEERGKRQELERRLAALEGRQQSQQPQPIDPVDDPEGYNRQVRAEVANGLAEQRFLVSERFAVQEHGKDSVEAAVDWATKRAPGDPMFSAAFYNDPDPIGFIVREHQKHDRLSALEKDEVAFARSVLERHGLSVATATPAAPPAPVPAPPKSIASAPSAGGPGTDVAMGTRATVDAAFKD